MLLYLKDDPLPTDADGLVLAERLPNSAKIALTDRPFIAKFGHAFVSHVASGQRQWQILPKGSKEHQRG